MNTYYGCIPTISRPCPPITATLGSQNVATIHTCPTYYCAVNQGGAQAQTGFTMPFICPPTGIPFVCNAQGQAQGGAQAQTWPTSIGPNCPVTKIVPCGAQAQAQGGAQAQTVRTLFGPHCVVTNIPVVCPTPTGIPVVCGAQAQAQGGAQAQTLPTAPWSTCITDIVDCGHQGGGAQAQTLPPPHTFQPGCYQTGMLGCPTLTQHCVTYQGAGAQTLPPPTYLFGCKTSTQDCHQTGMLGCPTSTQHCVTYQGGGAQAQTVPTVPLVGCVVTHIPFVCGAQGQAQGGAQAQTLPPPTTMPQTCQQTGMLGCPTSTQHCTTYQGGETQVQTSVPSLLFCSVDCQTLAFVC